MGILFGVIAVVVILIVVATAFPTLWGLAIGASGNITTMAGTDAGTTTVKAFWPVILLLVGIGVAIGLIMFALRKFGLFTGKGSL